MNNTKNSYFIFSQQFEEKPLIDFANCKIKDPLIGEWEKDIFRFILEWFTKEDFIIVKTSGSTGVPKKISLLKKHMIASAQATLNFLDLNPGDKALLCLPANYIAGKMMIVRAFTGGLHLNYIKPSLIPEFNHNNTYDLIALVPSMLSGYLKYGSEKDIERFKNILLGGSSISQSDEEKLKGLNNKIWHTYGMTETITHVAMRRVNGSNRTNWYKPLQGVKLSLSEKETLQIDYEKIGLKKLITNDIVEFNTKGEFKILGRSDNVIISGGLKIQAEILESKISTIIDADILIMGQEDKILGEQLVLYIEENINKSNQEIMSELGQIIPKIQLPKKIIKLKKFDRTESGKLIRKKYSD